MIEAGHHGEEEFGLQPHAKPMSEFEQITIGAGLRLLVARDSAIAALEVYEQNFKGEER